MALLFSIGSLLVYISKVSGDGMGLGIANPGSPHNFTDDLGHAELPAAGGWNFREEICRVCHVPHDHDRATDYGANGLLWNHQVSNATYVMYSSSTLNGTIASSPTGIAKMCLGCHDGTVGIDVFDSHTTATLFIADYEADHQVPGALFAGNLNRTHPISITYDEAADKNLRPKSTPMGTSGTIADVLEGGTTVQCHSCHDVHDQAGEAVPDTHLLRVSQKASQGQASGLCLTCHIK
ncbi:MAG: hypothetical protein HY717_09035 [Planctomycetes bacterium]|nr:hypothetical protein [Planctomycetota bacterium]